MYVYGRLETSLGLLYAFTRVFAKTLHYRVFHQKGMSEDPRGFVKALGATQKP